MRHLSMGNIVGFDGAGDEDEDHEEMHQMRILR